MFFEKSADEDGCCTVRSLPQDNTDLWGELFSEILQYFYENKRNIMSTQKHWTRNTFTSAGGNYAFLFFVVFCLADL